MNPGGRLGAYGLALPDLPGQQWLTEADDSWPTWSFMERVEAPEGALVAEDGVAVAQMESGRSERIERATATTTLYGDPPLPRHSFAHPILGTTAAAYAEWSGRLCFHAGCFLDGRDRAWGVLGDRESGKSSALAWLTARGVPVLSDDLTITDGEQVLAGPRCLDLREGAAQHLAAGRDVGLLGLRRRWRVDLPWVRPEAELGGWVVLAWGDAVAVDDVDLTLKPQHLSSNLGLRLARHPVPWLGTLARPMVRLARPQSWEAIDEAMEALLRRLDLA